VLLSISDKGGDYMRLNLGRKARKPISLPVIIISAGVILLSACGGDDDPGASPGISESPGTATAETEEPTTTGQAGSLEALSAAFLDGVDGKVEYRYISNFGQHPDDVWTLYNLGDNFRQDRATVANGIATRTAAIVTQTDDYLCTGTDFTTECRIEPEEVVLNSLPFFIPVTEIPEAVLAGIDGMVETELPGETIASLEASCFNLAVPGRIGVGPTGREEIKICFSGEGYLLSMRRTVIFDDTSLPNGELTLDAQEAGAAVVSDFEPLVPPSN